MDLPLGRRVIENAERGPGGNIRRRLVFLD